MLSKSQEQLVDLAETHIREFVLKRGEFSMFAIARQPDGTDQHLQSSGEFSSLPEELKGMFEVLVPLARDQTVKSTAICSHIPDKKRHIAIIDVETREDGRCIVILPFQKKFFGGWSFGRREYRKDSPRVFAL